MTSKCIVSEDVEILLQDIASINNISPVKRIEYYQFSGKVEGLISKTLAVEVSSKTATLDLFLKCALNVDFNIVPLHKAYQDEIYFYNVIYPAFSKFINEKSSKDSFKNVPKCYGVSTTKYILALENLKKKNYVLYNNNQMMNEAHIILVLRTFAKFHAVSFAYKHQKKEEYDILVNGTYDFFSETTKTHGFDKILRSFVDSVVSKLDSVKDKHILTKCDNLADRLIDVAVSAKHSVNEYSVICQGDTWVNNMMFLYEDKNRDTPSEVILVDWQIVRPSSVVFDIANFFYCIASVEAISNLNYYLRVYHQELCNQIQQLGSDPDICYPYAIFEQEWSRHALYGLVSGFAAIRVLLSAADELFDWENVEVEDKGANIIGNNLKFDKEEEYFRRMKILIEHCVENGYL